MKDYFYPQINLYLDRFPHVAAILAVPTLKLSVNRIHSETFPETVGVPFIWKLILNIDYLNVIFVNKPKENLLGSVEFSSKK